MKLTPIIPDLTQFPGEFHSLLSGAPVFDSSCSPEASVCYIDTQGDLHLIRAGQMTEKEQIEAYIKENNIRFSLAFGPILLENGELIANYYYPIGEVTRAYSRAALCQQGPLHYVLVTANYGGADIVRFAQTLQAKGILTAYTLDGGQTATIVTGDQLINRVDYGGQREISDIIYFATAIPNGG